MKLLNKLFGQIHMTWKKVIVFAILAGAYTGIINQIPALHGTSFQDIAVTHEWWFLFAVIIAANAENSVDSALKIFVFFLISQPIVFLVELPMIGAHSALAYYKAWLVPTLLTLPGGFVAYYAKKDTWYGTLSLSCAMAFLGILLSTYVSDCRYQFPAHLLTILFIVVELLVFAFALKKRGSLRGIVLAVAVCALIAGFFFNKQDISNYESDLPEGTWTCTTELNDGSSVSVKDGSFTFTYDKHKVQEGTLVFENENGETFTYNIILNGESVFLIPEE